MKFSIGDRVLLKYSGEEGIVVAIINNEMVEVDVKGVSFPAYITDIDHPYLKWFTDKSIKKAVNEFKKEIPPEPIREKKERLAKGIYLSFIPVFKIVDFDEVVDYLKVYLLNELLQDVIFHYEMKVDNSTEFSLDGKIGSYQNVYLHNVPYDTMNDQPRFHWRMKDASNDILQLCEDILRIKPSKLFEHIEHLLKTNEPSFSYLLLTEFKIKVKELPKVKHEIITPNLHRNLVTAKTIEPAKYELDLHIESLVENPKALNKADILEFQLRTLEHYVNLSIVHRQEVMIVIHGLGKGTLREEVHSYLKKVPEISRFKNEWSHKYGFGATEIWFRYF